MVITELKIENGSPIIMVNPQTKMANAKRDKGERPQTVGLTMCEDGEDEEDENNHPKAVIAYVSTAKSVYIYIIIIISL